MFNNSLNGIEKVLSNCIKNFERIKEYSGSVLLLQKEIYQMLTNSEKLTVQLRKIVTLLGSEEFQQKVNDQIIKESEIEVLSKGECCTIRMPLLPSRKKGSALYITETLQIVLKKNNIQMFKNPVIHFKFHIPREEYGKRLKYYDYDNIEVRAVINALVGIVLVDDNPFSYSLKYSAYESDTEYGYTELIFSPQLDTNTGRICE